MVDALRIVFAGTPAFAVPSLRALLTSGHSVIGVLTQPDRPAGRGRRLAPPPVKVEAEAAGVPVHQRERIDRAMLVADVGESFDLLVVVAFGQILPAAVLELPRQGAINIHASLLPRWRGAAPIAHALLAGDGEAGVSIMRMTKGLDAGPVLSLLATPIAPDDTSASLHDRLSELGATALLAVLTDLPGYLAAAVAQDGAAVTHAPKLTRAAARIDWRRSADAIERAVRAFHPWPGAHTEIAGVGLHIRRAESLPEDRPEAQPGTVLSAGVHGIDVATGSGTLRLIEVQPAGRRAMAAADFANARAVIGCVAGAAP